jgi:flavodoxin I
MKALIIYDSLYGNTEQIAKAIGQGMGGEVKVARVGEAGPGEIGAYDLLVIGSPTQGGKHTVAMKAFLDNLAPDALQKKRAAVFDTRIKTKLVKIFGYAAGRMADALVGKGVGLVAPAEGFLVKGTKGPLVEGELERAAAWGKKVIEGIG